MTLTKLSIHHDTLLRLLPHLLHLCSPLNPYEVRAALPQCLRKCYEGISGHVLDLIKRDLPILKKKVPQKFSGGTALAARRLSWKNGILCKFWGPGVMSGISNAYVVIIQCFFNNRSLSHCNTIAYEGLLLRLIFDYFLIIFI